MKKIFKFLKWLFIDRICHKDTTSQDEMLDLIYPGNNQKIKTKDGNIIL